MQMEWDIKLDLDSQILVISELYMLLKVDFVILIIQFHYNIYTVHMISLLSMSINLILRIFMDQEQIHQKMTLLEAEELYYMVKDCHSKGI